MKKLLIIILFVGSYSSFAQNQDPIITDRPTQTPATAVMPAGRLLVETGLIREVTSKELHTYTLPNLLLRYGVNEFFEIRLQQDFLFANRFENDESGFNSAKFGIKVRLAEERGWRPEMSLLGNITSTFGQRPFKNEVVSSDFSLVFANSLSDRMFLGYSMGMINGESGFETSIYTLVLGYSITDKLSGFIEPYGFGLLDNGPNDHRMNAGLLYLLKHNIQFDASTGVGISAISPDYFFGVGAAVGF